MDRRQTAVMVLTKPLGTNGTLQRLKFVGIISQSAFVFVYFFTKVDTHTSPPPPRSSLGDYVCCVSASIFQTLYNFG